MSALPDDMLLATHRMSGETASCERCGLAYPVILRERTVCGKAPVSRRIKPTKGYWDRVRTSKDSRYGWIRAVVEPEVREALIEESLRQETSLSEVVRQACRAYLTDRSARGWSADELREAIKVVSQRWTQKPLELDGWLLVFGMTPAMVEDIITELTKPSLKRK